MEKPSSFPVGCRDVDEQVGRIVRVGQVGGDFGDNDAADLSVVGIGLEDHDRPLLSPSPSGMRETGQADVAAVERHGFFRWGS